MFKPPHIRKAEFLFDVGAGLDALAQERESTRLQALQLRLYIQTSRVAALEGALAKHVAAVGKLQTSLELAPEEEDALALAQRIAAASAEVEAGRPPSQSALALAVAEAGDG